MNAWASILGSGSLPAYKGTNQRRQGADSLMCENMVILHQLL